MDFELLKDYIEGRCGTRDFCDILESDEMLADRVRIVYARAKNKDTDIVSGIIDADRENPCLTEYLDGIVKTVLDNANVEYKAAKRKKPTVAQLKNYERKKSRCIKKLPLTESAMNELFEFLEKRLAVCGCDNTFKATREFLTARGYNADDITEAFIELGAHCDCEVLLNVDFDR